LPYAIEQIAPRIKDGIRNGWKVRVMRENLTCRVLADAWDVGLEKGGVVWKLAIKLFDHQFGTLE
jgi:hypothetical protein